jgi:acyl carrier protein
VSPASAEAVRALILAECENSLALFGHTAETVPDDFDLRAQGVIDSLGFLELVTALETALGVELDFDGLEPEDLTVVGPLSRFVAAQATAALVSRNGVAAAPEAA